MTKHNIVDVKTVLRQINPDLMTFNGLYNSWMTGVEIVPTQTACQLYDFEESHPLVSLSLTCTKEPKLALQGETTMGPLQKPGASEPLQTPWGFMYLPFSGVVQVGEMVWLSGQLDVSSGDSVENQVAGVTKKIEALLSASGLKTAHILHSDVLFPKRLADDELETLKTLYGSFLSTSSTPVKFVHAAETCANCKVEICVMASTTTSSITFE